MKTAKISVFFDNTEIEMLRVLYLLSQNEYKGQNKFLLSCNGTLDIPKKEFFEIFGISTHRVREISNFFEKISVIKNERKKHKSDIVTAYLCINEDEIKKIVLENFS